MSQTRTLFGDPRLVFESLTAGLQLTMSMVVDEAGATVNSEGNSAGLGNQTDLELLKSLRRNSDVVLTSGETFRADKYRFPKSSNLAVLSHQEPDIEIPEGRKLHWMQSSFSSAIGELGALSYKRIQVEYGLTGLRELKREKFPVTLFVSSNSSEGLNTFLAANELVGHQMQVSDLFLAVVAWQEKPWISAR